MFAKSLFGIRKVKEYIYMEFGFRGTDCCGSQEHVISRLSACGEE